MIGGEFEWVEEKLIDFQIPHEADMERIVREAEKLKLKTVVPGLTPDEPVAVNERGGKQSATPYRFDLLPAEPLFDVARVLAEGGAKYGDWNWLKIDTNDHINHALQHLFAFLAGDESDEHLAHAMCRCLFAAHMNKLSNSVEESI